MPASMDKQKVMHPKPTLLVPTPTSTQLLAPPHPHLMQQLQHPQHLQSVNVALPLNTTMRNMAPILRPAPPPPAASIIAPPAAPPTAPPTALPAAAMIAACPLLPIATKLPLVGLPSRARPPPAAQMPPLRTESAEPRISPAPNTLLVPGFGAPGGGRPAGSPSAPTPVNGNGPPTIAGLMIPSVPAQAPLSATLTSADTLLPEKPCYMISLDETGAQVPDPAPNYAKHVTAIPANSMLDEFFNQKFPSVVSTPEISWSTVIEEIDGLRLRQFREARALFYISRTIVSKTDAVFPFHEPDDTFNSCIEALTAVSGIDSPDLTLRSDPAMVYSWCVKACLQFGNDLRAERTDGESGEGGVGGKGGGTSVAKRPRLSKETSAEALQLLSKLNYLLG